MMLGCLLLKQILISILEGKSAFTGSLPVKARKAFPPLTTTINSDTVSDSWEFFVKALVHVEWPMTIVLPPGHHRMATSYGHIIRPIVYRLAQFDEHNGAIIRGIIQKLCTVIAIQTDDELFKFMNWPRDVPMISARPCDSFPCDSLYSITLQDRKLVYSFRDLFDALLPLGVYSGFTPAATPVVVCTRMLLIVIIGNRVDWLPAECLTKYFSNYWNQSFALEGLNQTGRPLEPR